MQTKTLKSGWRTIRPIIVELLTALIQVDRFSMEKEEITHVELLDGAVEHVRKASGTCPDLANWPTHGAEIDRACRIQHAIQKFRAWIASVARMVEVEKGPEPSPGRTRLCSLTFLVAVKKEGEKWRRRIRMRMQMQTLQTRMQMNFRLHQRNRRHRRLARSAAEICSLKPVASASSTRKSEAAQALKDD